MLSVWPQWPLYVVSTGSGAGAPLYVEDVFMITSDFEFACCMVSRLTGASSIVRVTRLSNFMCVKPQATHSIRFLDQRCARHSWNLPGLGTVCSDVGRSVRCQICIKVDGMWSKKELVSVRASAELPPLHLARCYPYFIHESLDFDQINPFRHSSTETEDKAALRCAKSDWAGQRFFAKAIKTRLPCDVVWLIQEACLRSCFSHDERPGHLKLHIDKPGWSSSQAACHQS